MFIPTQIIDQAVTLIINTRDFCGNEREAVAEFAAEQGFKPVSDKLFRIARFRANARWNKFKRQAGVPEKHIF